MVATLIAGMLFNYRIVKTLAVKKYDECPFKKDLAKITLAIPIIIAKVLPP